MKKECKNNDHEFYCFSEEYITDDKIKVEFKCNLCDTKFSGVIRRI